MMFDQAVTAHLEMVQSTEGLSVKAFVVPIATPSLRWRLNLTSRISGGNSTVTQSGMVQSGSSQPVGTVIISANSQGVVTLIVLDGDREVARDQIKFGVDTTDVR